MNASIKTVCTRCGCTSEMDAFSSIDIRTDPSLKEKVLSGELFTWVCPSCGERILVKYPMMYHDRDLKLLIVLSDQAVNVEELPEGYTGRRVRTVGDLVEKIKIFDAGLDDVVVEMAKYVTGMELGKKAGMRFLKLDGADNEMIFTYPDKGGMEMLSVGFNVYEDCRGILSRHPDIVVTGLATVDADWLSDYIG